MTPIAIDTTVPLSNGVQMPVFGLGVFRAGEGTYDAVRWALDAGYRHVDTAHIYRNEEGTGRAVRDAGAARSQIFVTTKLWNDDHGYDETLAAFDRSLEALGLEYVDLYLMHWPVPGKRLQSWRAMERVYEEGRAKAIGVSNFMARHLDELMATANVPPAVNQFELHPFLQQPALVEHCRARGVVVEAYSPLAKAQRMDDPVIGRVAAALSKTPAQVMIRWALEKGFVVIPKSTKKERILENAAVFDFELGAEHMEALGGLDRGLRTAWDPTNVD